MVAPLSITMQTYSPNQTSSFLNAGSRHPSWITGWLLSRVVRECAWVSSKFDPNRKFVIMIVGPKLICSSLAWAELRLAFAHVFRKFVMTVPKQLYVSRRSPSHSIFTWPSSCHILTIHRPETLLWRDVFLPYYYSEHLQVNMRPVDA